ncbi:S24 family peptidase, partial [Simonsiella muelleri]
KKIVMPDNAMLPTFPQGSELTIDTSQTAIIDGKIYQIQSGERFFIRKIFSQISGSLKIVCDNPEFESVIVSSDSVQIVGRVIEWRVRD